MTFAVEMIMAEAGCFSYDNLKCSRTYMEGSGMCAPLVFRS